MALLLSENLHGLTLDTLYLRVLGVNLSPLTQTAHLDLGVYVSWAARQAGHAPVAVRQVDVDSVEYTQWFADNALLGRTPLSAAYDYLKTLPAYAAAVDV